MDHTFLKLSLVVEKFLIGIIIAMKIMQRDKAKEVTQNPMMKRNCWEFKDCRRGPGNNDSNEPLCPVCSEKRLHGVHGGSNAGRACWVVAGTMCDGSVQGTFFQKYRACQNCDFYKAVTKDEGSNFLFSVSLHGKLNKKQSL
jgi:hypothetical protein